MFVLVGSIAGVQIVWTDKIGGKNKKEEAKDSLVLKQMRGEGKKKKWLALLHSLLLD